MIERVHDHVRLGVRGEDVVAGPVVGQAAFDLGRRVRDRGPEEEAGVTVVSGHGGECRGCHVVGAVGLVDQNVLVITDRARCGAGDERAHGAIEVLRVDVVVEVVVPDHEVELRSAGVGRPETGGDRDLQRENLAGGGPRRRARIGVSRGVEAVVALAVGHVQPAWERVAGPAERAGCIGDRDRSGRTRRRVQRNDHHGSQQRAPNEKRPQTCPFRREHEPHPPEQMRPPSGRLLAT